MRHLTLLAGLLISGQTLAGPIDFGQASQYNAFIKEDYSVTSSDVEGRVAVGGNLTVNGGYDIGTQIIDYDMGDGPSLVVGGDINKTGTGSLNVYQSATLPNPVLGDVVLGGTFTGGPSSIGSITENSSNLPVDFSGAFAELEALSHQLAQESDIAVIDHGWALEFALDPNLVFEDEVYVFNVSQDMFATDWYVNTDGMGEDATVVFNIANDNGSTVDFSQANVFLTDSSNPFDSSDPLSGYFNKGTANNEPPLQLLYNFDDVDLLNLNSDLYGSVLAPTADIKANESTIYGQVIGKSWQGNMQINYNPFKPVPPDTTPVPEPEGLLLFALGLALVFARKQLSPFKFKPANQVFRFA
ncbi:choice-of-anchor A family protein [Thalassomonas actiniarum]|uniref:Choice-of-anchor A family protein n=1 Tax=Thalassomonas actiniarum TaxID=485447 RepID=A0AAE9YWR6_9GAMM|nr:choice-of-anchor A family protein [Thalassomonas actiniarum]WDE01942.1 choice-of-anchor A family protein [Thalassomonas actiniarum]